MGRFQKNYQISRMLTAVSLIILTGASACRPATPVSLPTPAPVIADVTATRPVTPTPTVTPAPTATPENNPITLTFWTVEPVSPEAKDAAGDFFSNTLRAFHRANPNLEINLILKKSAGKGGIIDFLRTTKQVAPTVLPDVAVMNATDLAQALADGLIQPLDGRLDRSIVQDLLPAARKMGTVNERLAGVPLALEMEHPVYNTLVFTTTPVLWSEVFSKNTPFLFPAKGTNGLVNDATLAQYFSAGGALLDDQNTPTINDQILRQTLQIYQQGVENGTIDPAILEAATPEELWPTYLQGGVGMAQISVYQYLTDRELLTNSVYAPPPVQSKTNTPVSIINGWALVLVTNDPGRQKAALSLIEWFLATNNNAAWNNLNKSIPTRDSSFQQLAGDDPYWVFLTEQLNTARPHPGFTGYDRIGRIIQQAVQQVISGEAAPDIAAATAGDALAE